jgi:hypothetical protein
VLFEAKVLADASHSISFDVLRNQPTHVAGKLRCAASVSTTSPADYHTVYVYVRTAPGVAITTVAHYKT